MTKPIAPDDVVAAKTATIPDEVFEAFNEAIARHWNGRTSTFTQDEVVKAIELKLNGRMTKQELFANGCLDVEDSYRALGWTVDYDKPGYCETYAANFTFKKKVYR